jgi:hypothetical protein
MDLVIVVELSTTPLNMLDPVEACIVYLWRKALLYSTAFYISRESAESMQATNISLERGGHKPYTIVG